jgi:DNA topoisomerase VI subunit A
MKSALLINGIQSITKEWEKQRKAEIRDSNARLRRATMWKPRRINIKGACWHYMEQAYLRASGGGIYPATARQVMYAIRRPVQEMTRQQLDDQYFTQTLLPDYMAETGVNWDVVYDDRGHLQEPHEGGTVIGLGTLSVRSYIGQGHRVVTFSLKGFPEMVTVKGPGYRYGAILFIEKEGFLPLLEAAGFAERYDLAIMSTKGVSNTSARRLVDTLCSQYQVPLLVLRDFDRAGFIIASTLQRDTRRYAFRNRIEVVDLGLRLEDALRYNLESETVYEKITDPKFRAQLKGNGATEDEIQFLVQGQRVELNAFASDEFVEWLTGKLDDLQRQGIIKKVIPDVDTLEKVYRANVARNHFEERVGELADEAWEQARGAPLPADLIGQLAIMLQDDPNLSWDKAIQRIIAEAQV